MPGDVPWALPPQRRYVFRNASVVDPVAGTVHAGSTVTIRDGLIESVEYAGEDKASDGSCGSSPEVVSYGEGEGEEAPVVPVVVADGLPAGTETVEVDVAGRFLCPGLIDCHVHLCAVPGEPGGGGLYAMKRMGRDAVGLRSARMAREMIGRGFTSARDCGGAPVALREAVREGAVNGPRLFLALNQLSQTGGHGDTRCLCGGGGGGADGGWAGGVSGDFDFASSHKNDRVLGSGRLCDGADECLWAARDQVRRGADFLKIMGGGGVSSPTDAIDSVQFTTAEVQAVVAAASAAGTYVSSHAYTPASIRNAIDNGVRAIEHGNLVDAETARLMAERGVFLTPTLATYSAMADPHFAGYLPPEGAAKNREVLRAGLDGLRIADDAGVTLCFGTDLLGPMSRLQNSEFALRGQVLSSAKVLRSATVNAARLLMRESSLGQIRPGFAADLLVLNSNPLDDILVLNAPDKHLLAVMKDGRVHVSRWTGMPAEVDRPEDVIE